MVLCFFLEQKTNTSSKRLRLFAEACYRYTPRIAVRENEAVFLEIGKSLHLFQGQSLPLRLQALADKFQIKGRVVSGHCVLASWIRALVGQSEKRVETLAIDILPICDDVLEQKPEDRDERERKILNFVGYLKKLGIKNVGDFFKIATTSLGSRFGQIAGELQQELLKAAGRSQAPDFWPIFRLSERIQEQQDLSDPSARRGIEGLEPLLFMMRAMVERLVTRVRARSEKIASLRVEFEQEWSLKKSEKKRRIDLLFSVAQSASIGILTILKNRFEREFNSRPLESEILSVEVTVLESVPGPVAQAHLFDRDQEETEKMETFYVRVQERLGCDHIFFAETSENYLPEKSWKKTGPIEKNNFLNSETSLVRPTRLLKRAVPVLRRGDLFFLKNKTAHHWKIIDVNGPERISGYWWETSAQEPKMVCRDYYRFVTQSGEHLWVFNEGGSFFLHGFFD
ncbi:MAG TPA: hypothetical protein PLH57_03060 [Oligoflexia bacterium]|nr:hypothetical protein [Oligoflexia bacterium]